MPLHGEKDGEVPGRNRDRRRSTLRSRHYARNEERFLSGQADRLAGARREEKASACSVRNDEREVTPLGPLLGAASEQADDNAGGGPIVVLMKIGAERGPVVVDIEQADVEVPGRVDIHSAAGFVGKTVR